MASLPKKTDTRELPTKEAALFRTVVVRAITRSADIARG